MSMIETVITWAILLGLPLICAIGYARRLIIRRRLNRQIESEWTSPAITPPLTEQHVRVLGKHHDTEWVGIKTPTRKHHFRLTVQTDDGNTRELSVDREVFDAVPDHAVGTLAFVGDRVYGFCED